MSILLTGAAGFIGFHVTKALLDRGEQVLGIDNLNAYYAVELKQARLAMLRSYPGFEFRQLDVSNREAILGMLTNYPELHCIIHLAAQAGVRHSLQDPYTYIEANVMGTLVMLEAARQVRELQGLVYASSSSVYGANTKQPFSTDDRVDHPVSLYGATKRSCELMAESYSRLFGLPITGLRFFTVYGPWGRPDMAAYLFTKAILAGEPIKVFNNGQMARDFTYIDDIVRGVLAAVDRLGCSREHRVYNLGNHRPEPLLHFVGTLERLLGRSATKQLLPMQPGDVAESFADIDQARRDLGFEPRETIETGLAKFVEWYKDFHRATERSLETE